MPAIVDPAIGIVKSASITSFSASGIPITYSYAVSNVGNETLSDVTVSDPMPGLSGIDCPDGLLAPQQSEVCTATYTTTQADVDAGRITNTGTATGSPPRGPDVTDTSTLTVPATQNPAMTMVKSATQPSFSAAGDEIDYHYLVTNTGNVTLGPVTVTDPMPGLTAVTCPNTALSVGDSETCTATYITTQADVDRGSITNTGTAPRHPTERTPRDSHLYCHGARSADPWRRAGQERGHRPLHGSRHRDRLQLPGDQRRQPDPARHRGHRRHVRTVDDHLPEHLLAPGASETCTATYTTTQADVDNGSVTNTASVTGTSPRGVNVGDSAELTIPASQAPAITLVKSANLNSYSSAGTVVTYQYDVTNTGNVTLGSVGVTDPMSGLSAIGCPEPTLSPGASEICTAVYTTTQADVDNKSITNTGTASGTPPWVRR